MEIPQMRQTQHQIEQHLCHPQGQQLCPIWQYCCHINLHQQEQDYNSDQNNMLSN